MALRNSQYDILIRAYNQKQLRNKHELDKRLEEIYAKIPRILEINQEIASTSVYKAKELLEGRPDVLNALHSEIDALSKERICLLSEHNYADEDIRMHYDCLDCQDTGYCNDKKCHCFKQAAIDMLYTQSNLKEILLTENFNNFSLDYYDDVTVNRITGKSSLANMREIHQTCLDFSVYFNDRFDNLLFYGDTGVGKTFLSNCIAKELLDHSNSVIYLTAIQLFELFSKNTFEDSEDASSDLLQYILACDLLIIDDLGTELTNSFTNSKLFYCLNERFIRRNSTIISTNLTLDRINQIYSERIFSRVSSNFILLKFYGADIRIKKKLLGIRP